MVAERPRFCACGCGEALEQTAKRPRLYASAACRKRAFLHREREKRLKNEKAALRLKDFSPAVQSVNAWASSLLRVPPGHPLAGHPMALPEFGLRFVADVLDPAVFEAALIVARKNGKSAIVALLCLAYLAGPLAGDGGWRGGVCSLTKIKARELIAQVEAIAESSGLADRLKFRRSPWPGSIESPAGVLEIFSGDGGGGHSASLDMAIVDELGLMSERDRDLVASMRAATSAKNGRFVSLSIFGPGPFVPEILERREHPGVRVHLFQAGAGSNLEDERAWRAANPGLGTIKSLDYMAREARRAAVTPADESFFRAQDLNERSSPSVERICSPSDFARCGGELPERDGSLVLGFDLGGSASMTAAVALWPGTGRVEVWGAFPSVPPLADRQRRDGLRYDLMRETGELSLYDGRVTPVGRFLQAVASRLKGQRVLVAGADRYRKAEAEQALSDAGVSWPIQWRGTGASATADGSHDVRSFQRMVLERRLFHGDSLLLASAVAGSKLRYDGAGNPALDKQGGLSRIDSLSAAVIACGLAELLRAKKPKTGWRHSVVRAA